MEIVYLTAFLSVLLAAFFIFLFWRDTKARQFGGAERASLLPLDEEKPVPHSAQEKTKAAKI